MLPELISPNQSSFVPGRQISGNIVVVQEIFHSMRKKKGKKGLMIMKLDLEKAYDRLRWDFVRDTLMDVGLPDKMIQIIMTSITSASMRLLWNGVETGDFRSSRGIRQGDPISPYIFVLCMERLAHRIRLETEKGVWKPIRLTRGGTMLTHLFFADDVVGSKLGTNRGDQGLLTRFLSQFWSKSEPTKISDPFVE